jgi:O-antigen/teichoic acid export membrane protein
MVLIRSIAARFALFGLNGLTGVITARALDPAGRGQLAAMIIWPVLLAALTTLGLPGALIYHVRRNGDRASALIGCALAASAGTGLIATALGWYLVPRWLQAQPAHVVRAAQLCVLTTTVSSLTMTARAAWEASGHFGRSNKSQLIAPLSIIAALIPQAAFGVLTPRSAAATYVLAGLPVVIWSLVSVTMTYRPTLRGARDLWGQLLHFGCRSYGFDLFGVLSFYLDQALVVGLLAPESMGMYVVALSLSRVVNAVQSSVATIVFPSVVGLARGDLRAAVSRSARLSTVVSGAIGLVLIWLGGGLVTWLYGGSYEAAGRILPILVCEVILAGVAYVLLQGFLASGRPGVATLVQIAGLAFSIPLFLVLVPLYGAAGAAIALLSSTAIRLVLTIAAYPAFLDVPIPHVWIGPADIFDLATYRFALINSLTRVRTGETK